ncbi:DEAD/DEAH box helicase [Actinospica sp.]|uniref:DEAD/DEAH box helicase n=1 Tax=Actinospica sp. TaxID=1872142 RepID=UPI002CA7CF2A|nr:SNF2-related protein [Actinospica sp.]HWG26468.1 SNF2-related protein [Actinospica sp.]
MPPTTGRETVAEETIAGEQRAAAASDVRALLERAAGARAAIGGLRSGEDELHDAVRVAYQASHATAVRGRLTGIPVDRLRDVSGARLPAGKLAEAGYRTVADLVGVGAETLRQVPGIGAVGAERTVEAVGRIAEAAEQSTGVTADMDLRGPDGAALLSSLYRARVADRVLERVREPAARLGGAISGLAAAAKPLGGRVRRIFLGRTRRTAAQQAFAELDGLFADPRTVRDLERIEAAGLRLRAKPPRPATARNDFEKHSADYFSTLSRIVGDHERPGAARGFLPDDLAGRISAQQLDETHLRVSLRAYQAFGARFALAQRRVVLGDEMGCGKTVEAIAALAHLRAGGARHFLVICPASVLVNWMREVASHSSLRAHRLHGSKREAGVRAWIRGGGVGVTTFEALQGLELPRDVTVSMLVVDEAHYVKNPDTLRSAAVRAWTDRVERVLFLTGTPMENRVEEFRNLVGYLQPELVGSIGEIDAVAGSEAFRRAVGPAYLRRNQEDVLSELPELVQVDEWCECGPEDEEAYREAVAARNFMAMRRAAYASGDPAVSAKLRRLVEIVDEAEANGRKVVVFSYFRDVLDLVCETLGERAVGPLTGGVPPTRRQEMVDGFSAAKRHAVLASQIQAGGVGLNMQAASVVILCEPQVKPTLETQAIARAHRMGQIRRVQVHRLLAADSVDQRMLEILEAKKELFDAFARRSDTAETMPEAVEIGPSVARQVIAAERERLGLGR